MMFRGEHEHVTDAAGMVGEAMLDGLPGVVDWECLKSYWILDKPAGTSRRTNGVRGDGSQGGTAGWVSRSCLGVCVCVCPCPRWLLLEMLFDVVFLLS